MTRTTIVRSWLSRAGTALLVVGAVVGVTCAGVQFPASEVQPIEDSTVDVPPTAISAVCPGTLELPESTGAGDPEFNPVPVDPVAQLWGITPGTAAGPATLRALDGTVLDQTLTGGGRLRSAVSAPTVFTVQPGADATTDSAAATVVSVTDGDLRGLSGATCQPSSSDVWLAGGATKSGATAELVLINPGSTPAQVTWNIWGTLGQIDPTIDQALIAPGTSKVVNLAAVAGDQRALALRVRSAGGQIAAFVQDNRLDGYTPAGTDLVVPGAAPSTRQVLPGLLLDTSAGGDSTEPVLRVLVPGDTGATVTVTAVGGAGVVALPGVDQVDVLAGTVVEVPLGGLPADRYTLVVDAEVPVLASASYTRVGVPGELDPVARVDRALVAAVAGGSGVVPIPDRADSTVVVGAIGTGSDLSAGPTGRGTVEIMGSDGAVLSSHTVSIDAGTTGAWAIGDLLDDADQPAAGLRLIASDTGSPLSWAVVVEQAQQDGALITVLEPVSVSSGRSTVAVHDDPALGLG